MEKRDETLSGLEAELAEMEPADAVVTKVDPIAAEPVKRCDQRL